MALNTCCPQGSPDPYYYIYANGTFIDNSGNTASVTDFKSISYDGATPCWHVQTPGANVLWGTPLAAVPCACCPPNYGLVNSRGYVSLIAGNSTFVGLPLAGKCVSFRDFSVSQDSGDCPCCPPGFVYNSGTGLCFGEITGASEISPTVPCIPCNCTTPEPFECETCGSEGLPISFSINLLEKNCTDCTVDTGILPKDGKLNKFVATSLISPVINFTFYNL